MAEAQYSQAPDDDDDDDEEEEEDLSTAIVVAFSTFLSRPSAFRKTLSRYDSGSGSGTGTDSLFKPATSSRSSSILLICLVEDP